MSDDKRQQCIYCDRDRFCCSFKEIVPGAWFCNKHLDKVFNLQIRNSTIHGAGKGLTAGHRGFGPGEIIAEYSRFDIRETEDHFDNRCGGKGHECGEYTFCGEGFCWDARYTPSIIARYSNDPRDDRVNAEFELYRGRAFMIAKNQINYLDEIFCNYGEEYDWSFLDKPSAGH